MITQKTTHSLSPLRSALIQTGLAILGAALSLALTGFVFGKGFDLVHLPLTAALFQEPQFAHDPFIQSLRSFPSSLWQALEGASFWADTQLLFFGLIFLSRCLCFAGLLFCATALGLKRTQEKLFFVLLAALTPLLYRTAASGQGGLFLNAVSHSEMAYGFALFSLGFMARQKAGLAVFSAALTFFVAPYPGLWLIIPLALMALVLFREGGFGDPQSFRNLILGGLFSLPLVLPLVLRLHRDRYYGDVFGFDYTEFLKTYQPEGFLLSTLSTSACIGTALSLLAGFLFFAALARKARPFLAAYAGYTLLFLAGIVLPHMTHAPEALNLHLLQTARFLFLLTTLGLAVWLARFAAGEKTAGGKFLLLLAVMALAVPTGLGAQKAWRAPEKTWLKEWKEIGLWARAHTAPRSLFLPPVIAPSGEENPAMGSSLFEYEAHRRIWVDFARGIAVLWRQPYYKIWEPRIREVRALKTLQARLNYAHRRGIDYVIDLCAKDAPPPVFQTERLCVYATREN